MQRMAPDSPRSTKRAVIEELADRNNTDFLFDARLLWGSSPLCESEFDLFRADLFQGAPGKLGTHSSGANR